MFGFKIKNIRIIDPSQNKDMVDDILIENDFIVNKFSEKLDIHNEITVIDGTGKIVIPGIIDIHSHLREPGQENKETIYTGTRSAVKGGITTVFCMPNTNPYIDNSTVVESILFRAKKEGIINVFPIGCITKGSKGIELAEIGFLKKSGIIAISDDGMSISNSGIMKHALEYSKMFNLPVISHCEDKGLSGNGVMNEGKNSTILGLRGIPRQAEDIIVNRDIMLAELTNAHLHIAHVSTFGAVDLIRSAKKKGIKITAETCPHYFTLTDEAVKSYNTNTKVNPPLREQIDIEAIKYGLSDGTIDCICTDHAPHTIEDKNLPFDLAPFGIIGFETMLSLILNELVDKGVLNLLQAIAKITTNPAKIFKLKKRGSLKIGSFADLTIIDPNRSFKFEESCILSKNKNSPFIGRQFKGCVVMTMVSGKIVWKIF
ncbi:MAG: dihydroorotase [Endomicrobium sp.]|nr:dihydroorotase [Endomicrobium sp.]